MVHKLTGNIRAKVKLEKAVRIMYDNVPFNTASIIEVAIRECGKNWNMHPIPDMASSAYYLFPHAKKNLNNIVLRTIVSFR